MEEKALKLIGQLELLNKIIKEKKLENEKIETLLEGEETLKEYIQGLNKFLERILKEDLDLDMLEMEIEGFLDFLKIEIDKKALEDWKETIKNYASDFDVEEEIIE